MSYDYNAVAPWSGWTKSEIEEYQVALALKKMSDIKHFSTLYNLKGFVSSSDFCRISLNEWLGITPDHSFNRFGIPRIILETIIHEADNKARDIQRQQENNKRQMELQALGTSGTLNLGKPNSSFGRVYGG